MDTNADIKKMIFILTGLEPKLTLSVFCVLTKSTRFVHIKRFKIVAGEEKKVEVGKQMSNGMCAQAKAREREI